MRGWLRVEIESADHRRRRRLAWGLAATLLGQAGCMLHRHADPLGNPASSTTIPREASNTVGSMSPAGDAPVAKVAAGRSSEPTADRQAARASMGSKPTDAAEDTPSAASGMPLTRAAQAVPASAADYPIDLTTALRLAERENPVIAESRARIGEALAVQQQARALLLPTLNAGANYHGHTGDLQRSSGRILSLSEQSFYFGGGARTLAAESVAFPAIRIFSPLADALFEPLAARQQLESSRFTATATANTVLLEVATLFLELEGAEARLEALRRTEEEAIDVAGLTVKYSKVGQRPPSDADRSVTNLKLIQAEVQRAQEGVAVASTRLVRRLHLDPDVRLRPMSPALAPITLIDPALDHEQLVQIAVRRRPEMGARGADVATARTRLRQEVTRPLLPTISVGFSGGAFGGGSNLNPPLLGQFGGRTDFDVFAYWTIQNFGFGNAALQKSRRAAISQAEAARARMASQIRREVIEARSRADARGREVEVARQELASAEAGYRADMIRARGAVGRPIEVLDSLKLLARARQNLIRAIVGQDQSQFALFVALGSPPPLVGPDDSPRPIPMASPALPPLPGNLGG